MRKSKPYCSSFVSSFLPSSSHLLFLLKPGTERTLFFYLLICLPSVRLLTCGPFEVTCNYHKITSTWAVWLARALLSSFLHCSISRKQVCQRWKEPPPCSSLTWVRFTDICQWPDLGDGARNSPSNLCMCLPVSLSLMETLASYSSLCCDYRKKIAIVLKKIQLQLMSYWLSFKLLQSQGGVTTPD